MIANEYANLEQVPNWNNQDWRVWWDTNEPALRHFLSREELSNLKHKMKFLNQLNHLD